MRGRIEGALQLGDQVRNGALHVVGDSANGSPIVRFARNHSKGLKQRVGGDMVRVGDKWNRHPAANGFIFRADVPRVPAGPVGEEESARNRQQEGEANSQCAPPRCSHDSI
jgi:hypothetical protein